MANRELSAGIRELLVWVSAKPRTYAETLDAWRSTCPRHTVWEDACLEGLVRVEDGGAVERVVLTEAGRSALGGPDPQA